jgi:mannose-1-phosphate guanylyltransferase
VNKTWAVVLAGGDGMRLRALTTDENGIAIPKQFCSLQGGPSLLQKAVERAMAIAPLHRTCAIVAAQHRLWRHAQLYNLSDNNVIEQPCNRGTAHGMLLAVLHIIARDPDADVIFLPADHYVQDERVFANALRRAAACAAWDKRGVYLLGVQPEEADSELGYIVPEYKGGHQPSRVMQFVEKPSAQEARTLIARGALWNTFILASSARALLALYERRFIFTLVHMRDAVEQQRRSTANIEPLTNLYEQLACVDFSRHILQGQESRLQVVPVPSCGWTDLGTPSRVANVLMRLGNTDIPTSVASMGLDLAAQHARLKTPANSLSHVMPSSVDRGG